jgi:hypothetical protein
MTGPSTWVAIPVHEFPVSVSGRRPEPDGIPSARMLPHGRQSLIYEAAGKISAVVAQAVYPDLAAVVL